MQNYYDQRGSNNAHTNTALPADYLNFIASTLNNNELLNSSFNLKKSMNSRDWLNNSMNLPPELRYQHLNVMVDEITQDDLLNSTNSLNFSLKLANKNKRHNQQQAANVHFIRQDSLKEKENNFMIQQKSNDPSNSSIKFYNQKQLTAKPEVQNNPPKFIPHHPYENSNQPTSEVNSINNMNKLVYPPSFSHQFSTLTLEQHNYLLQQQRQLFISLNANNYLEQQALNQQHQYQHYLQSQNAAYQGYNYHTLPNKKKAMNLNNIPNMSYEAPKHNMNLVSSSSSTLSSPTSPQSNIINDPNQIQMFPQQQGHGYDPNNHEKIAYQMSFNNFNYGNKIMMEQNNLIQLNFANHHRYVYKQPYRHHRRTGPANELHVRLEECLYQLKSLESERKKIEIEQSSLNINKKHQHTGTQIPRLSSNPSRVDRLIVEALREHGKIWALVTKLETLNDTIFSANIQATVRTWLDKIHNVQAKRKDEVMNGIERQRIGQPMRLHDDQEVIGLANSINELVLMTCKIRTAIWCALQISNVNYKQTILFKNDTKMDQFVLRSEASTNDFIKQTFKIKTDLTL